MRKNILTSEVACILCCSLVHTSIAQNSGKSSHKDQPDFISRSFEANRSWRSSNESPLNEISIKAVRHFIIFYKDAENVHWHKTSNGNVVFFSIDSIATRADYDNKGHWLYTIRTYDESHLPKEIRHMVKSTYYDFSITSVNEISNDQEVGYIIQLEDKTSLKTVTIEEGEMKVVREYDKQ